MFGGAAKLEAFDAADGMNDNHIDLSLISPTTGYRFDGVTAGDYAGNSVSGGGDIDGDGFADLIVGAPGADPDGGTNNGASYIIRGGAATLGALDGLDAGGADGRIDLINVGAGSGARLDGERINLFDQGGKSVAMVGDVNGDGFADVLVGAPNADPNSGAGNANEGAAYLVFGQPGLAANIDLAGDDGVNQVRFDGVAAGDYAGSAVNGAGDMNGDGLADIVIGASGADPHGGASGSAYVVFGQTAFSAAVDLASLNGSDGFRLDGLRANDLTGASVASVGDVNGDGFDDLAISAHLFDRLGAVNAGALYVVFGKATGFSAVVNLGSLNGNDGFRIEGAAAGDQLGFGIAGPAGDINGDGFDDIVMGAVGADTGGTDFGSSYVIYGHRAETAVTRIGTELDNRINGGVGDDTISGLSGNDTLIGWEGDDLIKGGDGSDVLDGGLGDDELRGGSGADTFLASLGADAIFGGSGADLFDFSRLNAAVSANLATGLATYAGGSATFASIEALSGGALIDTLTGDGQANRLSGLAGNDVLNGAAGNDTLVGGLGRDMLTGGAGADTFVYNSVAETGLNLNTRDRIADFTHLTDRIDLSAIDAIAGGGDDAFSFIGTGAFTAAGQVRAVQSGADTFVELNTGGSLAADAAIQLTGFTAATLTAADFVL